MEINTNLLNKPIVTIEQYTEDKKIREQSNAFEALILKYMLDSALNMEDSLYEKGAGSEIYNSMYKDTIANSLSGSFGYGDLLYNYLKEQISSSNSNNKENMQDSTIKILA